MRMVRIDINTHEQDPGSIHRIRDKIAALKRKGLWMGGNVPLGYDPNGRTLTINETEAMTVCAIYRLYHTHKTIFEVTNKARRLGLRSKRRTTPSGEVKGGNAIDRGHIYHILTNPTLHHDLVSL